MFANAEYEALFASIDDVKAHRAAFLAELETGSVALADVFVRAAADPVLHSMKVLPAIEALPDTGKVSTRRAFGELGIDEAALIADVPADAVDALADTIARHVVVRHG